MPAVSVPVEPPSVPFRFSVVIVSAKVATSSVAPVLTVAVAPSSRRSAAPSASVPPVTFTVVAPAVPVNVVVFDAWVSVPAPRLPVTVPPLSV